MKFACNLVLILLILLPIGLTFLFNPKMTTHYFRSSGGSSGGRSTGGSHSTGSSHTEGSSGASTSSSGAHTSGGTATGASTSGTSAAGAGVAGAGVAGAGVAGAGVAGAGVAGAGAAGTGATGAGATGAGATGAGAAGAGAAGAGAAGAGAAGATTTGTHSTGTTTTGFNPTTTGTHTGTGYSNNNRNSSSFFMTIVGIIIFCASFPLLWYNEKRGVRMAKMINEGLKECIEVNDYKCIKETEGCLVCVHGEIFNEEIIIDEVLGVRLVKGIKMHRKVEIFQLCEEKHNDDEHSYQKTWVNDIVDSSYFTLDTHRGKNERKTNKFVSNKTFYPNDLRVGEYGINNELKEMMKCEERLSLDNNQENLKFDEIKNRLNKTVQLNGELLYISKHEMSKPRIGDLRISYDFLPSPRFFTIVARQKGNMLEPYYGKNVDGPKASVEMDDKPKPSEQYDMNSNLIEKPSEKPKEDEKKKGITKTIRDFMDDSIKINWLFEDRIPLDVCFSTKLKEEGKITWLLRLIGFLMMTFGVYFFFAPLLALVNWIPILGTLISFLFFIFSLSIGISLSLITISIAWLFYRPIVGVFMIIGSVLLYIFTVVLI